MRKPRALKRALALLALSTPLIGAVAPAASAEPAVAITAFRAQQVVQFDTETPGALTTTPQPISGVRRNELLLGIDYRPANGLLYALGDTGRLYTLNPDTGAATQVRGPLAGVNPRRSQGFDFNPVPDRLRLTNDLEDNDSVDADTGAVTNQTNLAYVSGDPNFGRGPEISGSGYTNNSVGTSSTTLYDIDSGREVLARQSPIADGALNTVGKLPVRTTSEASLDVSGATDAPFAILTPEGGPGGIQNSRLYNLDLSTGDGENKGQIGAGNRYRGLAIKPGAQNQTLQVDDGEQDCPDAQYDSVQDAVNAANAGDTVSVCAGTYAENVTVSGSQKNGVSILNDPSADPREPRIEQPQEPSTGEGDPVGGTGFAAVLRFTGGVDDAQIQGLTIAGTRQTEGCNFEFEGVRVDGGATNVGVDNNRITDIRSSDPALLGCQQGVAVQVGNVLSFSEGPGDEPESDPATASVQSNEIDRYGKVGADLRGTGTGGGLNGNTITGDGPISETAQNGVQIGFGANPLVLGNNISDHQYVPPPGQPVFFAGGILLFQGNTNIQVLSNNLQDNDLGIDLSGAVDEGFGQTSGAALFFNSVSGGIEGIAAEGQDGPFGGAVGNFISTNSSLGHSVFDCVDRSTGSGTGMTANTWRDNTGALDDPEEICEPPAELRGSRQSRQAEPDSGKGKGKAQPRR